MIIKNGLVFSEDGTFTNKDLYIENGIISNETTDSTVVDATDLYVIPGLVDIHSHGACGFDFSDANSLGLSKILEYQRENGITSYCPTTMSLPVDALKKILTTACHVKDDTLAGVNLEGPFLDAVKKGAHDEKYIILPNISIFEQLKEVYGNIKLITIAPNIAGADNFISALNDDVTISLGHTSTDYNTAKEALQNGARHITHLFNAMTYSHRNSGLIGAAADNTDTTVELISDGVHTDESTVRTTFKLFRGRVALISDSMRATGLSDGEYDLGGQAVMVHGNLATLKDGTIAGSVTNLYNCMKTAVSFGVPLEDAIIAATATPAKVIGIYDKVGSLTAGKVANVLLVDKQLNLIKVI